ncbi:MAG: hypothetical protein H7329_13490 [Opitutaceae bacterium]|nr:hypothetical protein [Cytophagales bacterium]
MKKLMFLVLVCLTWLSYQSYSQSTQNDPSYSVHNYKHPNKAARAKEIQDSKPVVYLEEIREEDQKESNSLTMDPNYKTMSPTKSKIKKYRVVAAPCSQPVNTVSNNGNYKQQFQPRTKSK